MKNEQGLAFHLHIKEGDIGRYVLMPGDPARCEKIARYLTTPIHRPEREYLTWTGTLLGEKVSVVSTGIGCPSTAIAVEELIEAGADTMIRVGSSGAMQPYVHTGDVIVATGAIRDEGTTLHYLPMEFPAVANIEVVNALVAGAAAMGIKPTPAFVSQRILSMEKWSAAACRWRSTWLTAGTRGSLAARSPLRWKPLLSLFCAPFIANAPARRCSSSTSQTWRRSTKKMLPDTWLNSMPIVSSRSPSKV